MMKKFDFGCDVGSLRLDTPDGYFLYPNGVGDGTYEVEISDDIKRDNAKDGFCFISCFGVKSKVTVSDYDCENNPVYELKLGRYAVYNNPRTGNMRLVWWGENL